MKKEFLDLCYDIIRRYTSFPDVAGTAKDISDGIGYAQCYQLNQFEFSRKYNEIVSFIIKVRANCHVFSIIVAIIDVIGAIASIILIFKKDKEKYFGNHNKK